jgi:hypothetical protein
MTPSYIKDVFERRGFHDALRVAQASGETHLVSLVDRLNIACRDRSAVAAKSAGPGKTARRRESGALARAAENRARRAAENRARCRAHGGGQGKNKKVA